MNLEKYKIISSLLLLFFSFFFAGKAPAAESYRLEDLVKLLEQNNLLLKIAAIDRHIVSEEYRAARALPNPAIESFKGTGDLLENPEKRTVWGAGIKISVPNPFYRFFFLKSLGKTISGAEIEAKIKKNNIIRDLKEHYFRLQFARKIAALLQEKIVRLHEVNRITKAKASVGEVQEIDVLRTAVEIQENKSHLFKMEKIAAGEKTKINEFLNYTLDKDFFVVEDFAFSPVPEFENRIDGFIAKNPIIALKMNELAGKQAGLKAGRFSLIEAFEIFGEREKEIEAKIWKFGIGFSIPIFDTRAALVRKAKYEREKTRQEFDYAKKHLFAEINRITTDIRILEKEIETLTGAVLQEGRQSMEISERLYKEGEIPLVVFLDSQNSYFEIEQRYYEALTEWLISKAELAELLGEEI